MAQLIDLSQEIVHQGPTNPGGMPPQVWVWTSHEQSAPRYTTGYSFTNRLVTMIDHTSTHVDAPRHFDARPEAPDIASVPLDWFYGPAVCLDVSTTQQSGWIDATDLAAACERGGITIAERDIVLLNSGHHQRTYPRPEYFTGHPGLTPDGLHWLHERGVRNFGADAPNPGHPDDHDFEIHRLCQLLGMIHIEGLANLEAVTGKRFTFVGFPLRIVNGSGSPIRAVAVVE